MSENSASSNSNRLLSVVVAALLVTVIAVPIVSSKVDSRSPSAFTFHADRAEPACLPSAICFRFSGESLIHTASGFGLPLHIEGADDVFAIARDLDDGTLRVFLAEGAGGAEPPKIEPHYNLYFNFDEVLQRIPASLQFQHPPSGRITLAFGHAGARSEFRTLDIARGNIETFAFLTGGTEWAAHYRVGAGLFILLMALATSVAEADACTRLGLGRSVFASTVAIRWIAIAAAGQIVSSALCLLAVLGTLLPWLAIATCARQSPPSACAGLPLLGTAARLITPLWRSHRWNEPISIVEILVLVAGLCVFAYMLWFGSSFRWSIFEERDFLEARQVAFQLKFPVYGPELLLGGHTIGGGLYLLLAPAVALWNDPEALVLMNRLLFLGMAFMLWWGIRGWAGPAGALFAVFALIASERIVALSYWPIHPNFSLFFAVLYACAAMRGAVDGHRAWLISSGLLLGGLVQLHFSYFLLLPCHAVLVLLGNYDRDHWAKPLAIATILIPLAPFLIMDAIESFPNIAQIAQRPRFHGLYPNTPFGNSGLMTLALGWTKEVGGPFADSLSTLTMLLIGLGIAIGIGGGEASVRSGRGRITPALAASVLFIVPAFELTVLGMGYNTRHTLTMVPALFILAGFGFVSALNVIAPGKQWIGKWLILPLVLVLGVRTANASVIERISKSEGEWAIDYRSRQSIAEDLVVRLGMSPQAYAARTYWWWVGWSIDPEIYSDIYRRAVAAQGVPKSLMASDQYVLVTETAKLPPFLHSVFDSRGGYPVAGMYVHLATPKKKTPFAAPSANADTGVRLQPFLEQVDQLRGHQQGVTRLGRAQVGSARRDLFLATMAEGRIKLLVTTEQSEVDGRQRLRWCVDSPSLNGHYQEIKTVWRPWLISTPASGDAVEASLAGDVLGSLLYKAPRCGEAWSERIGPWHMSFAFDGVFDQSFMLRPELALRRWQLDFDAPIRRLSIPAEAVSAWIDARWNH